MEAEIEMKALEENFLSDEEEEDSDEVVSLPVSDEEEEDSDEVIDTIVEDQNRKME